MRTPPICSLNNLVALQKFASQLQHQHHHHHHRQMAVSTDALSLDGLLDSVSSCGSFSSPPNTPIKAIRTKTYFGKKRAENFYHSVFLEEMAIHRKLSPQLQETRFFETDQS